MTRGELWSQKSAKFSGQNFVGDWLIVDTFTCDENFCNYPSEACSEPIDTAFSDSEISKLGCQKLPDQCYSAANGREISAWSTNLPAKVRTSAPVITTSRPATSGLEISAVDFGNSGETSVVDPSSILRGFTLNNVHANYVDCGNSVPLWSQSHVFVKIPSQEMKVKIFRVMQCSARQGSAWEELWTILQVLLRQREKRMLTNGLSGLRRQWKSFRYARTMRRNAQHMQR